MNLTIAFEEYKKAGYITAQINVDITKGPDMPYEFYAAIPCEAGEQKLLESAQKAYLQKSGNVYRDGEWKSIAHVVI